MTQLLHRLLPTVIEQVLSFWSKWLPNISWVTARGRGQRILSVYYVISAAGTINCLHCITPSDTVHMSISFLSRKLGYNASISVWATKLALAHQPNAGKICRLVDSLHPPLIYWVVTVIYLFLYDTLQSLLGQSSLLSSHFQRQLWLRVQIFLTRCFLTGWSGFHPTGSLSSFPWVSSAFPGNE